MIKSIQLAFEKFLILIIVNKLLVIINYFMLKKGPAINENGETYHGNNSTGTKEQLLNNLKNKSLSGEKIELILEIIWEEIFDEESLEELVWKTKEELERIKKDKNLILEITWNKSICISALMELREVLSKDYRKFIFDLDYTLLIPDWSCEDDYFRENIAPEEQKDFFDKKQDILNEYETRFPKYNLKTLSDYFRNYGFIVSEKVIEGWMKYNGENIKDEIDNILKDLTTSPTTEEAIQLLRSSDIVSNVERKNIEVSKHRPHQAQFRKAVISACKRCWLRCNT